MADRWVLQDITGPWAGHFMAAKNRKKTEFSVIVEIMAATILGDKIIKQA